MCRRSGTSCRSVTGWGVRTLDSVRAMPPCGTSTRISHFVHQRQIHWRRMRPCESERNSCKQTGSGEDERADRLDPPIRIHDWRPLYGATIVNVADPNLTVPTPGITTVAISRWRAPDDVVLTAKATLLSAPVTWAPPPVNAAVGPGVPDEVKGPSSDRLTDALSTSVPSGPTTVTVTVSPVWT